MKRCPKCGLSNPPESERCDCGYDFVSGSVKATLLSGSAPPAQSGLVRTGRWLTLGGLLGGIALGRLGRAVAGDAGLAFGVLGDVLLLLFFAGVATWIIGSLRSRRNASLSQRS
jgi:predicted lipid-binding transport protein (Tim44 family)